MSLLSGLFQYQLFISPSGQTMMRLYCEASWGNSGLMVIHEA